MGESLTFESEVVGSLLRWATPFEFNVFRHDYLKILTRIIVWTTVVGSGNPPALRTHLQWNCTLTQSRTAERAGTLFRELTTEPAVAIKWCFAHPKDAPRR